MTTKVGLIGWPVEHSVSPAMHNAAFGALGLDWRYHLLPTPATELEAAVMTLRRGEWAGANITVPHKEAVIPLLDSVSPAALIIGAVNTLLTRDGALVGDNTDAEGFLADLTEAGFSPAGRGALVLGAGGAARAIVYALVQAKCTVTIHNRTPARALALAAHISRDVDVSTVQAVPHGVPLQELDLGAFELVVNTTSVGMWPHKEESAWPEDCALPAHLTVYDLVYNPAETRLLRQARSAGLRAIGGLGMLVHQGALAFERWTGQVPPLPVMGQAARGALTVSRG